MQNEQDSFKRRGTSGGDNNLQSRNCKIAQAYVQSYNYGSVCVQVCRLTFWFACFFVIVGVVWRPPLSSVGLIAIFLVLLVALEWVSRRLTTKKLPPLPLPESETIQQQMSRTRTAQGLDRLTGTFWAEFSEDVRTTTVHIPFCPAFERVPNVQVFPVDAADVSLRIISPKTFGVRVDVKRNNSQSNLEDNRIGFAVVAEG